MHNYRKKEGKTFFGFSVLVFQLYVNVYRERNLKIFKFLLFWLTQGQFSIKFIERDLKFEPFNVRILLKSKCKIFGEHGTEIKILLEYLQAIRLAKCAFVSYPTLLPKNGDGPTTTFFETLFWSRHGIEMERIPFSEKAISSLFLSIIDISSGMRWRHVQKCRHNMGRKYLCFTHVEEGN